MEAEWEVVEWTARLLEIRLMMMQTWRNAQEATAMEGMDVDQEGGRRQILVKVNGRTRTVEVGETDTVWSLKVQIWTKLGYQWIYKDWYMKAANWMMRSALTIMGLWLALASRCVWEARVV